MILRRYIVRHEHNTARLRFGLTLLEMLMVMAIIVMVAALVVPSVRPDERLHQSAAASILVSDIELAIVMSIADPKNTVVVRFDPAANAYWLAHEDSPDDPILRAGTNQPYYVQFGQDRARGANDVTLRLEGIPDNTLYFSAHGGLADLQAAPKITLQWDEDAGKYETQITIAATTGSLKVAQVKRQSGR